MGHCYQKKTGQPTGVRCFCVFWSACNDLVFVVGFGLKKAICRSYCQCAHYRKFNTEFQCRKHESPVHRPKRLHGPVAVSL